MSQDGGGRRFMDRVFGFLGIEQEPKVAQEEHPPWPEHRVSRADRGVSPRRGRLVSLPGARKDGEGQRFSVVVQKPVSFDDVQGVVDCLKEKRPVIMSVALVPKEIARRLVDFVSGAAYALDGRMHRLGESLFLFTPSNVGIDVADGQAHTVEDFVDPDDREV